MSKVIQEEINKQKKEYIKKTVCIYNPYDFSYMRQRGEEKVYDYTFNSQVIVSQGRLNKVKNFPRLIKSFYLVHKKNPNTKLLIIGEGEERERLTNLINRYQIDDVVTLLGFRVNPFSYISKSSLYVLSSFSEGFPNALIEGMTFLPTVSVDCKSGPREILSDKPITSIADEIEYTDYGILVPPAQNEIFTEEITYDDEILAESILAMLANPEMMKQCYMNSKKRVEDFSYDKYKNKLYDTMVN